MKILPFFTLLILLVSPSCEKERADVAWYQYAQTGCADKWEAGQNHSDKEVIDAVKTYLTEHSIQFDRIMVAYDSSLFESCKSCFCKTGRVIWVYTSIEEEAKLSAIGFKTAE